MVAACWKRSDSLCPMRQVKQALYLKDLLVDLMFNTMGTDAKGITGSNPDQVAI